MTFTDLNGTPLSLVLYKYDSCFYCQRVLGAAGELGLKLPMRDIIWEAGARDELVQRGGKGQVPCLMINGVALYESEDIVAYLQGIKVAA